MGLREYDLLVHKAKEAAHASYSPYSQFRVGAALLCRDGEIILGTNVENRSYGLTQCAERSAICSAVVAGKRGFRAIAVYALDSSAPIPPCGACRQVLSEFAGQDFKVIFGGQTGELVCVRLTDLLPRDSLHELSGAAPQR